MKKNILHAIIGYFGAIRIAKSTSIRLRKSAKNSLKRELFANSSNPLASVKIALVVLIITITSSLSNGVFAQCSYVLADANNVTTTTAIPCDFPVLIDTGNPAADMATYDAAKTVWLTANPGMAMVLDVPNTAIIFHIEISNSVFQAYSQGKQAVILANSYYYHITP